MTALDMCRLEEFHLIDDYPLRLVLQLIVVVDHVLDVQVYD